MAATSMHASSLLACTEVQGDALCCAATRPACRRWSGHNTPQHAFSRLLPLLPHVPAPQVDDAVEFAKNGTPPPLSWLYKNIYKASDDYMMRGVLPDVYHKTTYDPDYSH